MSLAAQPASQVLLVGVVDDDDDLRRALRRLLLASAFRVQTYSSAEEFLASNDSPDCLVLDIHLGGMTGLELYGRLKERTVTPPVVFMTAHDDYTRELERGGTTCLLKPFDDHALIDAIEEACGRSR
jgi:FixJ family two-component response regulator